jgi:hypothetical protein
MPRLAVGLGKPGFARNVAILTQRGNQQVRFPQRFGALTLPNQSCVGMLIIVAAVTDLIVAAAHIRAFPP